MAKKSKAARKLTPKPKTKPAVTPPKRSVQTDSVPPLQPDLRLPLGWNILVRTGSLLWNYRWTFLGSALIYLILNFVIVQGFKLDNGTAVLTDGSVKDALSSLSTIISNAGSGSGQTASVYQSLLALLFSLAVIWTFRHVAAGTRVRVRDGYYQGMYPLVPFVLVLLVVIVQLLPLALGATVYSAVLGNTIAVSLLEKVLWGIACALPACLTLFWLSSSLFALYVVTLPNMTPLKALRSAKRLVRGQRWTIFRKVLFLPLVLLVLTAVLMAPFVVWLPGLTVLAFSVVGSLAVLVFHGYMYLLYRELIHD